MECENRRISLNFVTTNVVRPRMLSMIELFAFFTWTIPNYYGIYRFKQR